MSAHYRCIPMYEYIRPGIHVQFSQIGDFMTNDAKVIAALDGAAPFIERVGKEPEVVVEEVAEEKAEVKPKASRTTRK